MTRRVTSIGNLGQLSGEPTINESEGIMGDKSPKSVQKQAAQKRAKANAAAQKKQQSKGAKQVGGKR